MRATQDLDALDIENVQNGTLRAGDIYIVHIQADAGLEAPERVLLANAADKADQRGVGTTRHLNGGVRGLGLKGRDVHRTGLLQTGRAKGGNRNRNFTERFFTTAGRHGNDIGALTGGCAGFLSHGSRRHECQRRYAGEHGGRTESAQIFSW